MPFFRARAVLVSTAVMIVCLLCIVGFALKKNKEFMAVNASVVRTHDVIADTLRLVSDTKSMISDQRGYLLTYDRTFLDKYNAQKADISNRLAHLREKMRDNMSQTSRLEEFQHNFLTLADRLEQRALKNETVLDNETLINDSKNNIVAITDSILEEEYTILNNRITTAKRAQDTLLWTIILGILVTGGLIFMLNYYLFKLKIHNRAIGIDLTNTEERFKFALEAAQEGVFDWDITTGQAVYSGMYAEIIGRTAEDLANGTVDTFKDLLHEEDKDRVCDAIDRYIQDQLSELSLQFRMLHADGRNVWISARGVAVRDENGLATRIIGTHRDITDHKVTEKNLVAEVEVAEEATKAKSEFLAHMSHEIRTPLSAISGIAEILSRNADDFDDRQQKLIKTLAASTTSLKELVNDILDFSKIERGEIDLYEEYFHLPALMSEVISIMAVQAGEKGLSFTVNYDEVSDLEYYGDMGRIRQILFNLIGNAVKFTRKGSVDVDVKISSGIDRVDILNFIIKDTGVGIDGHLLDIVFDEFKQGDSSVSREFGGTGLGLPISKRLAVLMGGDISVSSKKGKGSVFTLQLPLVDRQQIVETNVDGGLRRKLNDKLSAAIHHEQRALIVEDYEGNLVIVTYMLEEVGLAYDIARNGQEAVDLWKTKHYDIVLMDVQMPVMDGLTATQQIRRLELENKFPETPIIGMTAHALVGDKNKCIEAGMTDYLPKPINSEEFKQKILKYIGKARDQSARYTAAEKKRKTGT